MEPQIKAIYKKGLVNISIIKGMIVADVIVVLFIALINSTLIDIINSTVFWSLVITFFVYRENFRKKMKNLVGLQDWVSIEQMFKEPN